MLLLTLGAGCFLATSHPLQVPDDGDAVVARRNEPRGIAFALAAAEEALAAAGGVPALLAAHGVDGTRVGVAFGTGISGVEELLAAQATLETRGHRRVSPYLVPNSLVNMAAGRISIAHGLRGPNHAVSTACATGAHSIGDAFRFIKYGDADVRSLFIFIFMDKC